MVQNKSTEGIRPHRGDCPRCGRAEGDRCSNRQHETSDGEKIEAKLLMEEIANADRANARNREIEITKSRGQRDWMQVFVGSAAMIIGIVMVVWAKTGVEDKEIFFHILGFAEGTLVGQVVNYYFGSAKK